MGKQGGGLPEGSGLDRPRELAVHTPSRLGFPDGPDIAVGGRLQPSCGRTRLMPRQRIHHTRETYEVPDDFPERLERFKEESGLTWSRRSPRRLGTYPYTVWRWAEGKVRPNYQHRRAGHAKRAAHLAGPLPAETQEDGGEGVG